MAQIKSMIGLLLGLLLGLLAACTSLQPRPAQSSYGCMRAVRQQLPDAGDKQLHCLAAAQIARQCSVIEAYLAGIGKELSDLLGPGNAQWSDWRADRVGVHCGVKYGDRAEIEACCRSSIAPK